MPAYALLALAILFETLATSAMKASEGFTKLLPSLATVAGYAVSFWLLSQVLRTVPVGVAYAIWSGVGIVLIALIGRFAFGQTLDAPALAGIGLIIAGVIVIQLFSKTAAH